ncbi:MAG TPA: N-acetyl-alpha-D-glucosaminyl L-malate synthase BshA [Candidatus Hydrogenedentes bacterium]|nr:N-acetyl-alpha-D-glucosaminyl L-malate synthase BshA [Candidatus Hydrogenedentota bacterium]HPG69829.1 N-acetyl-alpha-D-glucosaminyl L-malate synthase BshA [Candidatus Hydrogenedentota bacterium]
MNIGITCHATTGGSGALAVELGMALAERGHRVHFVTLGTPFRLREAHENVFTYSVETVTYPVLHHDPCSLALAALIAQVAREKHVEVWHAHYAIPHAAAAIIAREMMAEEKRFKLVTTLHGTDITLVGTHPSFLEITRFSMERSDAVTTVSNWLRHETQREFALSRPIETIYNFVDQDRFVPRRTDRSDHDGTGEKVIMHISNFRPVKRVTDAVRVFKRVSERLNARLVMVGDGPERLSAAGVARQLGIEDRIEFTGIRQDLETLIPRADLMLQPSEHESFGLVPLEAMACEVPVLATASGGTCEVVEDGVTGYLCEVGDIETMAARAIEVLGDTERAKVMGRNGRRRALRLFARETTVDRYESLYHRLVDA